MFFCHNDAKGSLSGAAGHTTKDRNLLLKVEIYLFWLWKQNKKRTFIIGSKIHDYIILYCLIHD